MQPCASLALLDHCSSHRKHANTSQVAPGKSAKSPRHLDASLPPHGTRHTSNGRCGRPSCVSRNLCQEGQSWAWGTPLGCRGAPSGRRNTAGSWRAAGGEGGGGRGVLGGGGGGGGEWETRRTALLELE